MSGGYGKSGEAVPDIIRPSFLTNRAKTKQQIKLTDRKQVANMNSRRAFIKARNMPPLRHSIAGKAFNIQNSEAAKWLCAQPEIMQYVFEKVKGSSSGPGEIIYDPENKTWRGIEWLDDAEDTPVNDWSETEPADSVEQIAHDAWKLLLEQNDMLATHAIGIARPDVQAVNEIGADIGKIMVRLRALGVDL